MRPSRRAGFTLIELLITISIFLILATVTLTAVSAFQGGDQVTGSARQVQSYISGARDRAIYTVRTDEGPRARGVRLLVNTDLLDANGEPVRLHHAAIRRERRLLPPQSGRAAGVRTHEVLFLAGDDPNDRGRPGHAERHREPRSRRTAPAGRRPGRRPASPSASGGRSSRSATPTGPERRAGRTGRVQRGEYQLQRQAERPADRLGRHPAEPGVPGGADRGADQREPV